MKNLNIQNGKLGDTEIPSQFTSLIDDFNSQNFNQKNITLMINFYEFLKIDDFIENILINLEPTKEAFDLSGDHLKNYTFPYFIIRGIENISLENNLEQACKFGMLKWLKFFHEEYSNQTIDLPSNLYIKAVKNGHLSILKYLHENNCTIHEATCFYAADNGFINCLKFVHECGCELDEEVFDISITREHFDVCDYLIEHNCPIDQISLCQVISDNNMPESLDYILSNNLIEDTHDLAIDLITVDNLECLEILHTHGLELSYELLELSAKYGSLDCMKYLHKNGCLIDENICHKAIFYANCSNDLKMLYYLIVYKCPGYKECQEFIDTSVFL